MIDVKKLREDYAGKIAAAKALAEKHAEGMTKEISDEVNGILGAADELKVQLDTANRINAGDEFINDPAGLKAAHLGFRDAGPGEGDAPIDVKAWREMEIKDVLGFSRKIRYHVPLTVQAKGYPPAFEAYLRRGKVGLGPNDLKVLSEGVDTAGGFTVPEDFQAELLRKQAIMPSIRAMARVVTTSRDSVNWPTVNYTTDDKYTSPVRMTWTGEVPASSTTHRATDPVFGNKLVPVHTAMSSLLISNDLIEDSVFDIIGIATELLAEANAVGEDEVFAIGDGISKPMGLLTEVDGNGPASIAANDDLTPDAVDIINMFFGLPSQYRANAKWLMNSNTMKGYEGLKDGQNRYLVSSLVSGSLQTPPVDNLKGKPVHYNEFMVDAVANGLILAFGDFKGYVIIDRVGLSVKRLDETYAEINQTALVARKRVGGYAAEPHRFRVLKNKAS